MELVIDDLTKRYGPKTAVNHFSATLEMGIHALLGPNGSGKTTLMRVLADVLRPDSGTVCWDGADISVLGERYREVLGYLPQNFGYYPSFTGWDFLMYFAALKGLPRHTAGERAEDLLTALGLFDERNKRIRTYSGGMRQRLGIVEALLNDPKLLILDEPTAGLDPMERVKFREMLERLGRDRVVLLSTHIVSDVEQVADSVMLMKKGRLIYAGAPGDHLEALYLSHFQAEQEGTKQ